LGAIHLNKTPLYERHVALGGKIIDFGGWALPVQYTGIIEEHLQTRSAAGLFDVSHMGEITVKGPDALGFLQYVLTNDLAAAASCQTIYALMCYPDGGVVDDLIVYKRGDQDYLLVVNAANTDKDYAWLLEQQSGRVELRNVSADFAQLALQGPHAAEILQSLCDFPLDELSFFHFRDAVPLAGLPVLLSRTGYTGEDGFEIYTRPELAPALWDLLLDAGRAWGALPVGLGARDTLRFEAALPLYGQEISESITPLEAGLGFAVKLGKQRFIGRDALIAQKEQGLRRRRVGFELTGSGIPRSHYDVWAEGQRIGFVTTGGYAPSFKKSLGLALVDSTFAQLDKEIAVSIRDRLVPAKVVKLPFYAKKYRK
jgi:aminomethyltransferase